MSLVLGGAAATAKDEPQVKPDLPYGAMESFVEIHAFFNMDYYIHGIDGLDRGHSGFRPSEFYLMFASRLSPSLYFNAELEQQPGRKPDEITVPRLEIHWAITDWLELEFGKFYCPVGIERFSHYAPINRLISRPLPALYIVPGTWSETGVLAHGDFNIGGVGVRYEAAMINGLGGYIRDSRQNSDNNEERAVAGRLAVSPVAWLTLGASGYQGTWDEKDHFLLIIRGLDLSIHYKGLNVIAEYFDSTINLFDMQPAHRHGYYAQASYRIEAEDLHIVFIEPVVRFDHMSESRTVMLLSAVPDVDRFSLGVAASPVNHFQFKFEYQWLWISKSLNPVHEAPNSVSNVVMEAVIDF